MLYQSYIFYTSKTHIDNKKTLKISWIYSPFSTWRLLFHWKLLLDIVLLLWACGHTVPHLISFQSSLVYPRVTGSTAAPRPQMVKGTTAWPLWSICCSRCEKSVPSSPWRRRRSCPTRQSWTPRRSAGPPVLSGASPLRPCTSSPESSSYTCWEGRKRDIRLMPWSQYWGK